MQYMQFMMTPCPEMTTFPPQNANIQMAFPLELIRNRSSYSNGLPMITYIWHCWLAVHWRWTQPVAFSACTPNATVSHFGSRADKVFRAIAGASCSSRWGGLVPIRRNGRRTSAAVCAHWVAFALKCFDVFILNRVYKKGVTSIERS